MLSCVSETQSIYYSREVTDSCLSNCSNASQLGQELDKKDQKVDILRTLQGGLPGLLDCPSAEQWHLGEIQCHRLHGTKTRCSLVKSWAVSCFESSSFAPSCSKTCLGCAAGLVLLRCRQTHSIWNSYNQRMTSTRQVSRFDLLCGST